MNLNQPGSTGAHHEQAVHSNDLHGQPGSQLTDLQRQFIEENRASRNRQLEIGQTNSDSETDFAASGHSPPKRRKSDDELSLSPSDQDIRDLIDSADVANEGGTVSHRRC